MRPVTEEEIDEVVKAAHGGNDAIVETKDFRDGVRHALQFMSSQKCRFTVNENYILSDIAGRVVDALSWDAGTGYYEDGGNFVYRCTKADYLALKRAYNKL